MPDERPRRDRDRRRAGRPPHGAPRRAERASERPGRGHLATTLHHVHLPKLVDAGVVEYDARSREVRYWPDDRLEAWHDRIATHEGT